MNKPFSTALRQIMPIVLLHIPLGIVCGILFKEAGYPWYVAPIYSFFVFAAAMQFLTLSILAMGGSLFLLVISLIPVGIRNIFYGLTMLERYGKINPFLRGYLAFGLIDGIYSLLQIGPRFEGKEDTKYITWLTVIAHSTWVLGTLLGSFADSLIPIPPHLEFSLTAFFAAAAFELFRKQGQKRIFAISLTALIAAILIAPNYLLLVGIFLATIGCLIVPSKAEVEA